MRQLARRSEMPTVNKLMGIGSFGFTAAFPELGDEWRWRIMHYSFQTQTPAPRGSTLRVSRHPNAYFHFGAGIERVDLANDELVVTNDVRQVRWQPTSSSSEPASSSTRWHEPNWRDMQTSISLWRDRYQPPDGLANSQLGAFPYLADDFSFIEREPGEAPWLSRIHCFNYGASISLGKTSGDIPGISEGASWLARSLAAKFYARTSRSHWQQLLDYKTPELKGDEWTASELPDGLRRTITEARCDMNDVVLRLSGIDPQSQLAKVISKRADIFELTEKTHDAALRP